jgi:hypothetical protein
MRFGLEFQRLHPLTQRRCCVTKNPYVGLPVSGVGFEVKLTASSIQMLTGYRLSGSGKAILGSQNLSSRHYVSAFFISNITKKYRRHTAGDLFFHQAFAGSSLPD